MSRRPEQTPQEHYLDQICCRLWLLSARERRETREELRQHLEHLATHAARRLDPKEAMEEAMRNFGDPQKIGKELSRQHLRHRRRLSVLLKTTLGLALTLLTAALGYSAYWYVVLSQPIEREVALTPLASAASPLAAIQAAQDGYARQIQSVRFQSEQGVHTYYQGHSDGMVLHTYQVAAKGDRYYSRDVSEEHFGSEPKQVDHVDDVYVSDGKTMRENLIEWNGSAGRHSVGERHGGISYLRDNNFKPHDPDAVLRYGYKVDGVWIDEMLRRGKPTVEGTVTDAHFGPLTVVNCQNKTVWGSKEDVRLWLAPRFGWVAVKTEIREANARPPFGLGMVHQTNRLVKSGAFWVASEGQMHYSALALDRQQPLAASSQHFSNIVFNDVPDSRFVLHDPVGTRVMSVDFQNTFVRQPSGQWKQEPSEYGSGFLSNWGYPLLGVSVIGIGLAFIVVTRKRQKRRLMA